jgi:hypothetical protein
LANEEAVFAEPLAGLGFLAMGVPVYFYWRRQLQVHLGNQFSKAASDAVGCLDYVLNARVRIV